MFASEVKEFITTSKNGRKQSMPQMKTCLLYTSIAVPYQKAYLLDFADRVF